MHHVIVKFLDGGEKTGDVFTFNMNFPVFYLQVKDNEGKVENQPIKVDLVKYISFLKKADVSQSILHKETIDQSIYAGALPYKLVVELKDGHIIDGSTNKYHPKDKGFFVVSLNPADKNERVYVNAKAVKDVNCKRLLGKKLVEQQKITLEEVEETFKQNKEDREKRAEEKEEKEREEKEREERKIEEGMSFIPSDEFFTTKEESEGSSGKPIEMIKIKPLGEIIQKAGYITARQLEDVLNQQKKKKNKKFGQLLVDLKYVTPNDICVALSTQCHLSWVDLSSVNIPEEVATAFPEEAVRELGVIPVGKREDTLLVATSQPQDPSIGMKISKYTSMPVELVIAYEGYIQSAIDRFFPKKE